MLVSHRTGQVKPALLLAVVLALLAVVPVSAAGPEINDGTWEFNYMPEYAQVCPGIEVWDHELVTFRQWIYFDNQGNVKSIKYHFLGTDNYYNPQNPDVVLSGDFSLIAEIDLETEEFINTRGAGHVLIPGYGTMIIAGYWSRYPDEQVSGTNSFEDPDDIAAFCAYLAGN